MGRSAKQVRLVPPGQRPIPRRRRRSAATSGPRIGRPGSGIPRRTPPGVTAPPTNKPKVGGAATVGGYAASADAEADRIIAELLGELGLSRDSARREAERTAQGEIKRAQALSQALTALGIPAQIQGIYGNASQSISGLAQGFSGDVQALANTQGTEQANMVAGTGQEGAVRNEGAAMGNVLYGLEGYIPARSLEQMGAAFSAEAALQPGFTQQFGQIAASKVMDDFVNEVLPEFTSKEAEIRTKRPSLVADAKKRRIDEAMELYEAGFMTQRELARKLGVKNWKRFPNTLPHEAGAGQQKINSTNSKLLGYLVDDFGNPIRGKNGKPIPLKEEPVKPNVRTWQGADGSDWMLDLNTGKVTQLSGPKQEKPVIRGSNSQGYTIFDPNTGQPVGTVKGTGTTSTKPADPLWKQAGFKSSGDMYATARNLARVAAQGKKKTIRDPLSGQATVTNEGQMGPREAYDYLVSKNIPPAVAWSTLNKMARYKGKLGPRPKAEPATGGRVNASHTSDGPDSLAQPLWGLFNYALGQGFTNLGTHNPASRLPGGGISDHAVWPARAFDIGGFSGGYGNAKARRMFDWLRKQPGVEYVILGDKIWSRSRGLHAYTAGGHDTHIHVSASGGDV